MNNREYVKQILKSLQHNYTINSINLIYNERKVIDSEITSIVSKLRSNRIMPDISIKSNSKSTKVKRFALYYPDE